MLRALVVILVILGVLGVCEASSKRGVCVWRKNHRCEDLKLLDGVHWWYNWGLNGDMGCGEEAGFLPMHWGYYGGEFVELNYSMVLGFNEPNHKGQANLSPQKAAQGWVKMQSSYPEKVLISPSAAPGGNVDTFQWFDQFFEECDKLGGCRVDYIATHSYTGNVDWDMGLLWKLYGRYNRKIWLTEFALPNTNDENDVLKYMEKMLNRLEKADYVYRYSWFLAKYEKQYGDPNKGWFLSSANSLITPGTSKLSKVGEFYNSFEATKRT